MYHDLFQLNSDHYYSHLILLPKPEMRLVSALLSVSGAVFARAGSPAGAIFVWFPLRADGAVRGNNSTFNCLYETI